MKRTLMLGNQELLDFEVDLATGAIRILDAPDTGDTFLSSLGLGGPNREAVAAAVIGGRCLSPHREDIDEILDAFGVRSSIELVFRRHGLSFSDKIWYRAPGSTERWEDVNFYDHDWDGAFRTAPLPSTMTTRSGFPSRGSRSRPAAESPVSSRYSVPAASPPGFVLGLELVRPSGTGGLRGADRRGVRSLHQSAAELRRARQPPVRCATSICQRRCCGLGGHRERSGARCPYHLH